MRVLLYLEKPDLEVVVVCGDQRPDANVVRGRPVFWDRELSRVLDLGPTPEEFRIICRAKTLLAGVVMFDNDDDGPGISPAVDYGEEDELVL